MAEVRKAVLLTAEKNQNINMPQGAVFIEGSLSPYEDEENPAYVASAVFGFESNKRMHEYSINCVFIPFEGHSDELWPGIRYDRKQTEIGTIPDKVEDGLLCYIGETSLAGN